jgi:hypothetical protein
MSASGLQQHRLSSSSESSCCNVSSSASLPPISSLKPSLGGQQKETSRSTAVGGGGLPLAPAVPLETAESCVNFFELYSELGKENYVKMTTCSYCGRRFRFVSVLLEHLRCHVANVEKIVEMKMKIWVKRGNLKCGRQGCSRQKYAYTLDYTKHRDSHEYAGLACDVCGAEQGGPHRYAAHMRSEHEEYLFLTETQPEDIPHQPAAPPHLPPDDAPAAIVNNTDDLSLPVNGCDSVVGTTETVASPHMYQPRSVGPPSAAALSFPLHIMDVKTPKSAPPVMLASSPGGGQVPPSPQSQPMSAPSMYGEDNVLDYSGDLLDHHGQQQQEASMPSMPCLVGGEEEEEDGSTAQNPPAPDVVNQPDSEDIMDILKDIEALGRRPRSRVMSCPCPSG